MKKLLKWLGVVLALVLVAAALGFGYLKVKYGVILGHSGVEARAAELLPGAKAPSGLKGVLALQPKPAVQVAAFAPSLSKMKPENLEGNDLRIIIVKPKIGDEKPNISEILERVQGAQEMKKQKMNTLEKGPTPLMVGGLPYVGLKSRVELKDSGKKLQERLVVVAPNSQPVIVMITGTDESFNDKAVGEFLAGLSSPLPIPNLPSLPELNKKGPPKLPSTPPFLPGPPGPPRP